MNWHGFVVDISNGIASCARRCHATSPLMRGTIQAAIDLCTGVGILSSRLRKAPSIAVDFARRSCFSGLYRGGFVAALWAAQAINGVMLRPATDDSCLYYPYHAVDQTLQRLLLLQYGLFILDVTVIGIVAQREVGSEYNRRCPGTRDTLQTTLVRVITPILVTAASSQLPVPFLRHLVRSVGTGCQLHDAALSTRGVCVHHRVRSWGHEGLFYIALGVLLESLPLGPANMFVAVIVTAAATMQPLALKPELQGECLARHVPYSLLHTPYNFSRQIVERLRRAFAAGAFAPCLNRQVPAATTLLKVYRLSQTPCVRWLVPTELSRPELHHLMAEVINDGHMRDALRAVDRILRTSTSRAGRNAAVYLPGLASAVSGVPPFVVALIRQILMDTTNVETMHQLQEYLARRYNAMALSRRQPLPSEEWVALGIAPGTARSWGLTVADMHSVWVEVGPEPIEFEEGCLTVDRSEVTEHRPRTPVLQSLLYDALSISVG